MAKYFSAGESIGFHRPEWDKAEPDPAILKKAISKSRIKEMDVKGRMPNHYVTAIKDYLSANRGPNFELYDKFNIDKIDWTQFENDQLWIIESAFEEKVPIDRLLYIINPEYDWRQMNQLKLTLKFVPFSKLEKYVTWSIDQFINICAIFRKNPNADIHVITEDWKPSKIEKYEEVACADYYEKLRKEREKIKQEKEEERQRKLAIAEAKRKKREAEDAARKAALDEKLLVLKPLT